MKQCDKLVRDKIPNIMEAKGKKFKFHVASKEEYTEKLKEKLLEEVNEFLEEPCLEEMVDIFEVYSALLAVMGIEPEELENYANKKNDERGAFDSKYILEWVEN